MLRINYIKLLLLFSGVIGVSFACYRQSTVEHQDTKNSFNKSVIHNGFQNEETIRRFEAVVKWLDETNPELFIKAQMTVSEPADTGVVSETFKYILSKSKNSSYCRVGDKEMFSIKDYNLNVDHSNKIVFLSPAVKDTSLSQAIPTGLGTLSKVCRENDYRVSEHKDGSLTIISFINEHHISCKEISVSFKSQELKPVSVLMRFTNPRYLNIKTKDKVMKVEMEALSLSSDIEQFIEGSELVENKGGVQLGGRLKGYKLIKI